MLLQILNVWSHIDQRLAGTSKKLNVKLLPFELKSKNLGFRVPGERYKRRRGCGAAARRPFKALMFEGDSKRKFRCSDV